MRRALVLLLACGAAGAADPQHSLPIDCVPGESCWVVNYVDTDPGPQARDYTCGPQTYDAHTGTDFGVRHIDAVGRGVAVLASAPGIVKRRRDGVADQLPGERLPPKPLPNACGNGVVIDHGEGVETQYCHMREGSVRVQAGDRVERGTPIGLVGRSGLAAFPHVHFTVRRSGEVLDPFTGAGRAAACGGPREQLWSPQAAASLGYRPASIFWAGIAGEAVTPAVAYGELPAAPASGDSPVLTAWAAIFGVRPGDELRLSLIGPAGETLASTNRVLERTQARYFLRVGKARGSELWPEGEYRVEATISRPDAGFKESRGEVVKIMASQTTTR
jgi:murein DD-endopeptidase MepM/ murein hydrolase activator NlpD